MLVEIACWRLQHVISIKFESFVVYLPNLLLYLPFFPKYCSFPCNRFITGLKNIDLVNKARKLRSSIFLATVFLNGILEKTYIAAVEWIVCPDAVQLIFFKFKIDSI